MGFDDANFQEPPDKAEYEAYEKEEKRKLSECCCLEGDFRFCHGEKDRLILQVEAIRKEFAIHSCPKSGGFCWLCAASDRVAAVLQPTTKKLCGTWVREMGPCVAEVPCAAHHVTKKRLEGP